MSKTYWFVEPLAVQVLRKRLVLAEMDLKKGRFQGKYIISLR